MHPPRPAPRTHKPLLLLLAALACAWVACHGAAQEDGFRADDAYGSGQRLEASGDLDGAIRAYREALRQNPKFFAGRLSLAQALQQRGQKAEALQEALRAAELDKQSIAAQLLIGQLSLDLGEPQRALDAADRALAADPEHPQALHIRAQALLKLGRADESLATYDQFLKAHPNDLEIGLLAAQLFWDAGREQEALRRWGDLARRHPKAIEVLLPLGMAYSERGNQERAIEPLKQAIALQDDHALAHLLLGRAYLARGQDQLAVIELQRAAALDPKLADAQVALGEAELRRGYPDRAQDYARAALALDPSQSSAHALQADISEHLGDVAGADRALQEAIADSPEDWRLGARLARLRKKAGRTQEAWDALAPFANKPDARVEVHLLAADLRETLQDPKGAISHLHAVVMRREDPQTLKRLLTLASQDLAQSGLDAPTLVKLADQHFQETRGRDLAALLWLAQALLLAGDEARAQDLLKSSSFASDERVLQLLKK